MVKVAKSYILFSPSVKKTNEHRSSHADDKVHQPTSVISYGKYRDSSDLEIRNSRLISSPYWWQHIPTTLIYSFESVQFQIRSRLEAIALWRRERFADPEIYLLMTYHFPV